MKLYPILSALSPHHVVESAPHGGFAPQLEMIQRLVNSRVAVVDRIAVVTHDAQTGLLKTLVSNNRDDGALLQYDALSNRRAYKNSWDDEAVCAELRAEAHAGLLDKDCVDALLSAREERASIKQRFADVREPGEYA